MSSPSALSLRFTRLVMLLASGVVPLAGQDLDREVPVPPLPVMPSPSGETEEIDLSEAVAAQPNEEIILEELERLRFVPGESDLTPGTGEGTVYVHPALEALDGPEFRSMARLFIGQPVSLESLERLQTAVRTFLAPSGHPFSVVYVPEQEITGGTVTLVVRQSVVGEVRVEGAERFSDWSYLRWMRQDPGAPLAMATVREDLAWINRHGFRRARPSVAPGDEPGTTDLILRVSEHRPIRLFAGFNNAGTVTTDTNRITGGLTWGNAFGLGDLLAVSGSGDPDFDHFRAVSAHYTHHLAWRHFLTLGGVYSETDGIVAQPFSLEGTSWQVSLDYEVPLFAMAEGRLISSVYGALEFKSSDNNFAFARIPITDNLTHVVQLRVGWRGDFVHDPLSLSRFDVAVVGAPGGVTNRNERQYFDISREGATPEYLYATASLTHQRRVLGEFTWTGRLEAQVSPARLIGSEQFGAGGSYSARGYEEGEVYADNGILLSQELDLFSIPLLSRFEGVPRQDLLSFSIFQDFAYTWNTDERPEEETIDLHSVGVAAQYHFDTWLSVRFAYGWQLAETGLGDEDSRGHISAVLTW